MIWSDYGGFIGIEENPVRKDLQPIPFAREGFTLVTSARGALEYLLPKSAETLYVPAFLCQSAVRFVKKRAIIKTYHLNNSFQIEHLIELGPHDYILFVDYYGLNLRQLAVFQKYYPGKVLYDYTLNLYSQFYQDLPAFASIRKWYGLPDGAVLHKEVNGLTPNLMVRPNQLSRLGDGTKNYRGFLDNERIFDYRIGGLTCASTYTQKLLPYIHHQYCLELRTTHHGVYVNHFSDINELEVNPICSSLYYPLKLSYSVLALRQELRNKNIYVPYLWPDTVGELTSQEDELRDNVLLLLNDFRYTSRDIEYIACTVKELHEKHYRQSAAQDSRR